MQQRSALIVSGAAGPGDVANGVLQRFGFAPAHIAGGVADAVAQLRTQRFDLLVLPLQSASPAELAAIDRESRRHGHVFVIGTAAQPDSELIVRAMRSGVHEFLVYPPEPTELASAVDRLMRRTIAERRAGQLVAVFSGKGGVGTTTVAVNLAHALAQRQRSERVALADLVAGSGDVRILLNLRPTYDLADLARKAGQLDAELLQSVLTPTDSGVWVLAASEDEAAGEDVDADATSAILDHLRTSFGMTVVDCERHVGGRTLAALDAADRVVLVTQLNVAALRSARRTLALTSRLGYGEEKIQVVANRYRQGTGVSLAEAEQALRRPVSLTLPNDYPTADAALTRGVPVAVHAPASPLAASFDALAAAVTGDAGDAANGNGHAARAGSRLGRFFSIGKR